METNSMHRRLVRAVCCVLWALPAAGWWDGGHMQVVLVGCAQMEPGTVVELAAVVSSHPYYERDFAGEMPAAVRAGSELERARWLLAQASVWPDIVRDRSHPGHRTYNRSTWHYVNVPIFLDGSDAAWFERASPANVSMNPDDGTPRGEFNVVQALKWLLSAFEASDSDEERAVMLCWVLHLVGDLHQPMHAASVFSETKLREGDRGGNDVLVRGRTVVNLHRLWDSAPGTADDYGAVVKAARGYLEDASLVAAGESAAGELEVERWLAESYAIARDEVYTPALLAMIRVGRSDDRGRYGPFAVGEGYFARVEAIAPVRVVEAGYRLAGVLTQLAEIENGAAEAAPLELR